MSFRSKRELLLQTAPRYQQATESEKVAILNEFVAATSYARKYAIRLLNHPMGVHLEIERPRPRRYGREVQEALHLAWGAANRICAKRLVPFLPTLVDALERHGHLQLSNEIRIQLLSVSPSDCRSAAPALSSRATRPLHDASRNLAQKADSGAYLSGME